MQKIFCIENETQGGLKRSKKSSNVSASSAPPASSGPPSPEDPSGPAGNTLVTIDDEYEENLSFYLFTQAPTKSFLHKEQTEEELAEDENFSPPEGHSSEMIVDQNKMVIFTFGGFYPESSLKSDSANAIFQTTFSMNNEGSYN